MPLTISAKNNNKKKTEKTTTNEDINPTNVPSGNRPGGGRHRSDDGVGVEILDRVETGPAAGGGNHHVVPAGASTGRYRAPDLVGRVPDQARHRNAAHGHRVERGHVGSNLAKVGAGNLVRLRERIEMGAGLPVGIQPFPRRGLQSNTYSATRHIR